MNGAGLGLRFDHFDDILNFKGTLPWFEVLIEDFFVPGPHHFKLEKIASKAELTFHSVGLNIAGVEDFDPIVLKYYKELINKYNPVVVSDHLCFSSFNGHYHHDLLPFPRTHEALEHISKRINYLQNYFGRQISLENISSYVEFKGNQFSEAEFIKKITEQTGCGLIFDASNLLINSHNKDLDITSYMDLYPYERVDYIHLSGGAVDENIIIDSHSENVTREHIKFVQSLFSKLSDKPVLIERDDNIPDFMTLNKERESISGQIYEL